MESMTQTNSGTPPQANRTALLLGLALSILINGVLPFIIYTALTNYTPLSTYVALVLTGVPSFIDSIVGIIRRKRMDILAGIILAGIAVSLVVIALGGSPKVYLVRESFFTVALALAYLISLLFPRPLAFYFARHFSTGNSSENVAWFNTLWHYRQFRHNMRVITVVWGIGFLLEAAIRTYLVIVLSTAQFLIISPFVFYGAIGMIMLWTFIYSRQGQKRAAELRRQLAEQESSQVTSS